MVNTELKDSSYLRKEGEDGEGRVHNIRDGLVLILLSFLTCVLYTHSHTSVPQISHSAKHNLPRGTSSDDQHSPLALNTCAPP